MLMRDARLGHTWTLSVWMLVGVLAALAVPAGQLLAEEAAAPVPPPAATAKAPAPTATVAPVAPAAPIATPPAAVPVAPAAPAAAPSAASTSLEGTAEEAAATGKGDMGLAITVVPFDLQRDFRSMLHFFSVARFDLAKADAAKVLAAKPTPETVLALVEAPDSDYATIIGMMRVPEMEDAAAHLLALADEGARLKRTDKDRIQGNLYRLGKGPVAYRLALKELAYSGPYVVPFALALMQDPSQKELSQDIQRALVQIGDPVVLPLTRALATPDTRLRERIVIMLGDINYPYALPSLKALLEEPTQPAGVKAAATRAILRMGDESVLKTPAKFLYLNLAERYLSGKVQVADMRQPTTDVFEWVPGMGLLYRAAPSQCVADILAARACSDALKVDPGALEAVSLWLTAMMEMEGKTPGKMAREDDPFLRDTMPSLDYFANAAGQQHLYRVLDRAISGQNTPIAVRACQALGKVANQDFLMPFGQSGVDCPLVMALTYPDQRVRYAAAFALVHVRPTQKFPGYEKVVPALVEALNLEAQKSILLVEPDADNRNRLQAKLKEGGWYVRTAGTGNEALSAASAMLRIDAILVSSHTKDVGHGDLISLLRNNYETAMTPIIVLSYADDPIKATWLEAKIPYLKGVEPAVEVDVLTADIDALKKKAGSVILDPEAARAVSLQAAEALKDIAMTSHVFSADRARLSLLEALSGRPDDLVIAVTGALAQIPDAEIEASLAKVGTDAVRAKPVRVAALKALDRTARSIGNKIDAAQIAALQTMAGEADDQLRDASGEALGGLNLDAAEASKLILTHGDIESAVPAAATAATQEAPPPAAIPSPEVTPATPTLPAIVPSGSTPSTTTPVTPPTPKVTMPATTPTAAKKKGK